MVPNSTLETESGTAYLTHERFIASLLNWNGITSTELNASIWCSFPVRLALEYTGGNTERSIFFLFIQVVYSEFLTRMLGICSEKNDNSLKIFNEVKR